MILKNLKEVNWAGAKSMMADTGFLKGLVEFDKDSLSEKQVILSCRSCSIDKGNFCHAHSTCCVGALISSLAR